MLKIGIIGCGKIIIKHLNAIQKLKKNLNLVSVCDVELFKAKKIANKLNIKPYSNYKEMLKNENLDLVSLLTPHGFHLKQYLEISKFKINCIIEKPLAIKFNDAKKIKQRSKEIKKKIFVVKQNRFNPTLKYFNDLNKKKIFGNLFLGNATIRWRRNEKYFNQAKWRGTKKLDGGVIANQASHHLDFLIHTLGKVKSVHAMGSKFLAKNIEAKDTLIANLEFEKNKYASIEATTATSPEDIEGSISFLGTKGTIIIGGFAMNELIYCKSSNKIKKNKFILSQKNINSTSNHKKFYDFVIKNYNNNKIINKNLDLAVHVSEVIEAINKSAETNKLIKLKN